MSPKCSNPLQWSAKSLVDIAGRGLLSPSRLPISPSERGCATPETSTHRAAPKCAIPRAICNSFRNTRLSLILDGAVCVGREW